MKTFWIVLAGACGLLAAFFVWRDDFDKAFVAAASGAVCWFLNYRQHLRETLPQEDDENQEDDEAPDEDLHS